MKCCGQFWSLEDDVQRTQCLSVETACPSCLRAHIAKQDATLEAAQAELAALRGQVGRELTVEECDENAPLRNMAPLAVRVPRLPVRPEARPALRATKTAP